jgi:hypothetical protein
MVYIPQTIPLEVYIYRMFAFIVKKSLMNRFYKERLAFIISIAFRLTIFCGVDNTRCS